jgi:hypothetical protein
MIPCVFHAAISNATEFGLLEDVLTLEALHGTIRGFVVLNKIDKI